MIGNNVTNISEWAFAFCSNLKRVYFQGNAPGLGSDAFYGDNNVTVYYLPGTTNWGSTFGNFPTVLWQPQIDNGSGFGVQNNQFGFSINWAPGMTVVVEGCANLSDSAWVPISTNTLTDASSYFSDSAWTNYSSGFYRIRWP